VRRSASLWTSRIEPAWLLLGECRADLCSTARPIYQRAIDRCAPRWSTIVFLLKGMVAAPLWPDKSPVYVSRTTGFGRQQQRRRQTGAGEEKCRRSARVGIIYPPQRSPRTRISPPYSRLCDQNSSRHESMTGGKGLIQSSRSNRCPAAKPQIRLPIARKQKLA
jgi:hypothetical protein